MKTLVTLEFFPHFKPGLYSIFKDSRSQKKKKKYLKSKQFRVYPISIKSKNRAQIFKKNACIETLFYVWLLQLFSD